MCGIAVIAGPGWSPASLDAMLAAQAHRGPDDRGTWVSPDGRVGLGQVRLSILDLTPSGHQPMAFPDGPYRIVFNGEVYNYLELRDQLPPRAWQSHTDTEVMLAAIRQWGPAALDRFVGMFAFALWDEARGELFAARDRYGVKPLYYHLAPDGRLLLASEIKALHAAGVPRVPDAAAWATYLRHGLYDHTPRTFWEGITQVPAGGWLRWNARDGVTTGTWYDPARAVPPGDDPRSETEVMDELLALLEESVRFRFRSDVPVGICLSGGLDSSLLLALVHRVQGRDSQVETFSFVCNDPAYDETPWIRMMLESTRHPWNPCVLDPRDLPALADRVQRHQDEPFGGFPTLGMAGVFARARERGTIVLLDGNGVDEAWAGYEYYGRAAEVDRRVGPVQGARDASTAAAVLRPDFAARAVPFTPPAPFGDAVRDLQYRDLRLAKIPRAMRFADRVSMMSSVELREPFLDHRLVELGLRQPAARKVRGGTGKWLVRELARRLMPEGVSVAPKRAVQTPQREWLRGPLAPWAGSCIEAALSGWGGGWLDADAARRLWAGYVERGADNSFPVWQLISLGLMQKKGTP